MDIEKKPHPSTFSESGGTFPHPPPHPKKKMQILPLNCVYACQFFITVVINLLHTY